MSDIDDLVKRLRPSDGKWVRQTSDGNLWCDDATEEAADALAAQAAELANLRATNMELVAQVARLTGERDADLLSAQQKALNRLADAVRIKDFLAACDALDAFDRAIKEPQP